MVIQKIDFTGSIEALLEEICQNLRADVDEFQFFDLGKPFYLYEQDIYAQLEAVPDEKLQGYLETVRDQSIKYNQEYWADMETPLGQTESKVFALRSPQNIPLYCEILETMDLNHECSQADDIEEIVSQWKDEQAALEVIAAYATMPSQWGPDSLVELLEKVDFYKKFDQLAEPFAKYISNGYALYSYCSEYRDQSYQEPIWEALCLEEFQESLDDAQQNTFDSMVRANLKNLNLDCQRGLSKPALWHNLESK